MTSSLARRQRAAAHEAERTGEGGGGHMSVRAASGRETLGKPDARPPAFCSLAARAYPGRERAMGARAHGRMRRVVLSDEEREGGAGKNTGLRRFAVVGRDLDGKDHGSVVPLEHAKVVAVDLPPRVARSS